MIFPRKWTDIKRNLYLVRRLCFHYLPVNSAAMAEGYGWYLPISFRHHCRLPTIQARAQRKSSVRHLNELGRSPLFTELNTGPLSHSTRNGTPFHHKPFDVPALQSHSLTLVSSPDFLFLPRFNPLLDFFFASYLFRLFHHSCPAEARPTFLLLILHSLKKTGSSSRITEEEEEDIEVLKLPTNSGWGKLRHVIFF